MELFVPGRICLFGEHSDWAGGYRRANPQLEKGYTLICGTEQGIYARVKPAEGTLSITSTGPDGHTLGAHNMPMTAEALLNEARGGGYWSYVAGVAYQVQAHYQVGGLEIRNYKTDLPVKKGLSSSAAICVLVARAFNRIYGLGLSLRDEMELAYQGEITTPSRCGRMDQGCAFGRRPVLMSFDGDRLECQALPVAKPIHLVVVDLQGEKNTQRILADLNACYPEARGAACRGLQYLLGPVNRRMVNQASLTLQGGDGRSLGALMTEAQALFDLYAQPLSPEELAAPRLHRLLAHPSLQEHTWGGKGVGSQGDGAVQLVARTARDQEILIDLVGKELDLPCRALTIEEYQA